MDISLSSVLSQIMLGLNNGAFYALLSLGLAVIFGMLNVVNFAHGAFYMLGAFVALIGLDYLPRLLGSEAFGLGFWPALVVAPVLVGLIGVAVEKTMLRRLYQVDHLYGLLLTFGLALIFEGVFTNYFNVAGEPYGGKPPILDGAVNLGFMFFPRYRLFSIALSLAVCLAVWFVIERTRLGSYLRAGTENPDVARAFGIDVPMLRSLTYFLGVALAGLAGVVAAPIYSVSPKMGADLIIVVFAVVVIGGMGSIMGAILTGLALGLIEGTVKVFYPPLANTVIFIVMALVLLWRPTGLFGKEI
ncbi:branched-chain amino acid ABC transporter permease [Paludibacterium paludis]|uniref:Branched-chain amino acid ABC transporter permease n=1 Tax=Paludibacterium paludis TaxID=1225769 RepID=A0A918P3J4_9NEIS|nr:branched-chain amino acid ABC transporter permease [Paludibacterium paludis]GGY18312.1 branched-chain amino acid ABC transporter permease [Paludibacterium paludis]